jgi:hypothetical protein
VFGRKKTDAASAPEVAARPGAKNRPTPKRRDQEAARRRPLVVTDRKAARDQEKVARREALALQRQAMVTGDERHMPARDAGPARRYIRDYIDARRSIGEFLMPAMLVLLALSFAVSLSTNPAVFTVVALLTYGLMIASLIDAFLVWRRIKKQLVEKVGADQIPRGAGMYAGMRVLQMRPLRMPKPQVQRGQFPA